LHNVRTIGWLTNRATTQNIARTMPAFSARDSAGQIVVPALRWISILPSWILLAMIIVAASAVCATVILRARTELTASSGEHQKMAAEIDSLRRANGSLQLEINRLTNDSHAIELAARERLGMVRPNDVVVPIESVTSSTSLATLSFVR
jgi:cell division protein FtsL